MNASNPYRVSDWVTNSESDEAEIKKILAEKPLWKRKHARDLLARRRYTEAGKQLKLCAQGV